PRERYSWTPCSNFLRRSSRRARAPGSEIARGEAELCCCNSPLIRAACFLRFQARQRKYAPTANARKTRRIARKTHWPVPISRPAPSRPPTPPTTTPPFTGVERLENFSIAERNHFFGAVSLCSISASELRSFLEPSTYNRM